MRNDIYKTRGGNYIMKRVLLILMAVLMVSSVMVACTNDADETEVPTEETEAPAEDPAEETEEPMEDPGRTELNWNVGADPRTMDPGLNGASDGGDVINQTFEGLVREKSGVVLPGIAESWDISEDGLTVTFNLRDSKWSDGSDLTADDFVYSWLRAMDPATASEYSWLWHYTNVVGAENFVESLGTADEVGISAPDANTFVVELLAPTDYFVSLMSFYHFMPVKESAVLAGVDGTWASDPALFVSNGAFVLTEYTIGEGLRLEANANYWNAENVMLTAINGKFIDEATTAYQAYQAGDLDFIPSVPTEEIPALIAEDPNFYVFPLLGTYYYNFNMDLEIWQDANVRRAMALAIDRELICDTLGSGQVPAGGFVPPGFLDDKGNDFFETAGTYGLATDDSKIAEAQALMAEAGYPGGEGFPEFVMLYNTSEGHQLVAELIQEMFKTNLGITCTLENQEWAVFQDTRTAGDFELSRGGWLTDFMDPSGMLGIFKNLDVAYNDPNYYNEDFEAALNAASETTDPAVHYAELYKAQEIFMTDMPVIPVYHYSDTMLASEVVVGWDRSVLGSVDFTGAKIVE